MFGTHFPSYPTVAGLLIQYLLEVGEEVVEALPWPLTEEDPEAPSAGTGVAGPVWSWVLPWRGLVLGFMSKVCV